MDKNTHAKRSCIHHYSYPGETLTLVVHILHLKIIECTKRRGGKANGDCSRTQESDRKIAQAAIALEMEEVAFKQEVENLKVLISSEKASPALSVLKTARGDLKRQLSNARNFMGNM